MTSLLTQDENIDSAKLNDALGYTAERSNIALIVTDPSLVVKIRMRTDAENKELKTRLFGYLSGQNQEKQ